MSQGLAPPAFPNKEWYEIYKEERARAETLIADDDIVTVTNPDGSKEQLLRDGEEGAPAKPGNHRYIKEPLYQKDAVVPIIFGPGYEYLVKTERRLRWWASKGLWVDPADIRNRYRPHPAGLIEYLFCMC